MKNLTVKQKLEKYIPIAETIAETHGINCEVALHDLTQPECSVIHVVNGTVTGRRTGQSFDHLVRQVLVDENFRNDHLSNYIFETPDKRVIKSSSVLIRDDDDEVIGMICINCDITEIKKVKTMLDSYLNISEGIKSGEVEVSDSVMNILDRLIMSILGDGDAKNLNRRRSVELVKFMDEKGIFLVKGAVEKVAALMGVSKVTIYSYLDEAKKSTGK